MRDGRRLRNSALIEFFAFILIQFFLHIWVLLLLIAPTAIVSAGAFALLISAVRIFPRNLYTLGLYLIASIFPAVLVTGGQSSIAW